MSRIATASVEAVRDAVDMVDLVQTRTALRRSGASWTGRCPFHEERSPSLSVDPVKKLYHCFGCQRGGDAIAFVREAEGVDFAEAVEWLAERYHVELEREEASPQERRREERRRRLVRLLEDAAAYYGRFLREAAEGAASRAYLAERGIDEETAVAFRLGLSPAAWDRVCRSARAKGYADEELLAAGLAVQGRRGPIDRFRGRLMFPLADARGRVLGFGARQLPGGEPPKYVNSPEGPLFRKRDLLYGLDRARAAIARDGEAIVVEGYTDVLALHRAGIVASVASMGTALTERQVAELRRLCRRVLLAFDADAAGQEASLRGMELARARGLDVHVVVLPGGRDPADLVVADPEAFRRALREARTFLAYRIGLVLAADGSRDRAYELARGVLRAAPATPERDEQVRRVADRLALTPDLAAGLLAAETPAASVTSERRKRLPPRERDEELFLAMCLELPDEGAPLISALDVSHFQNVSHWEAATHIRRRLSGEVQSEELEAWAPFIARLSALAAQAGTTPAALRELSLKLELRKVEDRLKAATQSADLSLSEERELQQLQASRSQILQAIRDLSPAI